ncbi:MAG: CDP-diacylglycerol--glycerol-3-phosphate 3-phosphatidyltransferase [Burkholderiales bacterium]
MRLNIPNLLTLLRILLIPVFVAVFYLPYDWLPPHTRNVVATLIFAVAAVTDWLDGYLARSLNQTSAFGAFLDPVADKLMIAAALVVLVALGRIEGIAALIIVGREIAVSALREWMANLGRSKSVAVSFIGKLKTVSQMVAILLLLYHDPLLRVVSAHALGTWLIWLAVVLTLVSMFYYLRKALPHVMAQDRGSP